MSVVFLIHFHWCESFLLLIYQDTSHTRRSGCGYCSAKVLAWQSGYEGISLGITLLIFSQLLDIFAKLAFLAIHILMEFQFWNFLTLTEHLTVFAEHMMERLNLGKSILDEMNHAIALIGREKVVNMHFIGVRTDTIDTSDALHQSCGVPRCVVVKDNVGTM